MAIPTWSPGEVLASADVNTWFVPLVGYKSANQTVTSSTTLVNDTALVIAVAASAIYRFECFIDYTGAAQGSGDLKWTFTVPTGATGRYACDYISTGGTNQDGGLNQDNTVNAAGTNSPGSARTIRMHGSLAVASTAGNFQLQWAQNTSNTTGTTVNAQSYLMAWRIS